MIFVLYQWNDNDKAGPEVYVSSINMRYDREKRQRNDGWDYDEAFGDPGIVQDLYIQEDGYVNEEEIAKAIVLDMRCFTDNPLDVLVEYKFR